MKIFYTRNNAYDTLIVDDNGEIRFLTENNEFPKDDSEIEAFVQAVEDWSSWEEFTGTLGEVLEGEEVIYETGEENKNYVVIDEDIDNNGDVADTEWEDFDNLGEAIARAGYLYGHLSSSEKEHRSIYVLRTVNPDPDAIDHLDGDTVYNPAVGEFADMLGDFLGCSMSATTMTIAGVEKSGYLGGTDEMFEGDEFYQIFADETGAYKVYFEYSGQPVDEINYSKAYRAESYDTSWDEVREMMEKLHLC